MAEDVQDEEVEGAVGAGPAVRNHLLMGAEANRPPKLRQLVGWQQGLGARSTLSVAGRFRAVGMCPALRVG